MNRWMTIGIGNHLLHADSQTTGTGTGTNSPSAYALSRSLGGNAMHAQGDQIANYISHSFARHTNARKSSTKRIRQGPCCAIDPCYFVRIARILGQLPSPCWLHSAKMKMERVSVCVCDDIALYGFTVIRRVHDLLTVKLKIDPIRLPSSYRDNFVMVASSTAIYFANNA